MILAAVFGALSLMAIVALFLASELYFKPAEKNVSGRTLISFESVKRIDGQESLQAIESELQQNAAFIELEKQAEWPPLLEKVKKENNNPFSKNSK